jgi:hypothetical protein
MLLYRFECLFSMTLPCGTGRRCRRLCQKGSRRRPARVGGRGLHSLTSELNLRTFGNTSLTLELNLSTFGNTSLTLELNLSTFGTHPRVSLGYMGSKGSLSGDERKGAR